MWTDSLLNDENILSACSDFSFAVEIDIAFANLDFRLVFDFLSEYWIQFFSSYFFLLKYLQRTVASSKYSDSRKLERTLLGSIQRRKHLHYLARLIALHSLTSQNFRFEELFSSKTCYLVEDHSQDSFKTYYVHGLTNNCFIHKTGCVGCRQGHKHTPTTSKQLQARLTD